MSPELQQILDSLNKMSDQSEAKQWFNENRRVVIPLLVAQLEEDKYQYQVVIETIVANFPRGIIKLIRAEIASAVTNLLAQMRLDRMKPHWIDENDPPKLSVDDKGKPTPTQQSLVEILKKSKYLRVVYDEYTNKNYFEVFGEYKLPWSYSVENAFTMKYHVNHKEKETDSIIYLPTEMKYQRSALKYYMANFFEQEMRWMTLEDSINVVANDNRINVVRDHFTNGLVEWDGVDRFDVLHRHAGVRDAAASRLAMKAIMLGIMARSFKPGFPFRTTVVLVGDEKIGKSWLAEKLNIHLKFFLEFTFNRNTSEEEIGRKLEGRMVVELPDTGGLGVRNDNQIKSFLTQKYDNFRRMREDNVEGIGRSCIFIVTSNSMEYYLGTSGGTRFVPIAVTKFDREAIEAELPQLFAQAKYLWDHGETPELTIEEEELQQQLIKQQEIKPNFYYLLLKLFRVKDRAVYFTPGADGWQEGIKIDEILEWLQAGDANTWYSSDKESKYRSEIKSILKRYFNMDNGQRRVPVPRRKKSDEVENSYNYHYIGNLPWEEFIQSLVE